MGRKGITPIIAAVLLVAVSLSVVAIFSGWAPQLAQTITQETTNTTVETLECEEASISLESAFYDSEENQVSITVINQGGVDLPDLIVAAFDENEQVTEQDQISIESGELTDTEIENLDETPAYLQAFSQNCDNVRDRLDTINQ